MALADYTAEIASRKQGGKTKGFVTGVQELDARLRALPLALEKKLVRKALKIAGKKVLDRFRQLARAEAYETGAFVESSSVKAKKAKKFQLGVQVHIDRDRYFKKYEQRYGHKPHPSKNDTEPFYVPAAIEFGTPTQPAKKPQRRALYENKDETITAFQQSLRELIQEA